ncbi:Ycf66 family protein [Oscillatoria sp. FACHB-1407]|uniref:Ycf66 family protein n=1 Tax=Oscillatoria sp. FACHB-1407 TaxID=2692847 RepID=UPI0016830069|nr:Ycf66 family protein [Oscillatoria sp. FACHB-1407]MBD2459630.1 Ycf66 family protein [Oscillatoria sp. FACHB-1407]
MVNVGLSWSSIVGIALAVSGAGLYFLRTVRPGLARDHDIFFAAVALLCGGILFFQGWRQDPILQFGQFMLTGSTIWFAFEAIRLRGVATEQAKRTTPVVDDERPVSRVYRAELDELPVMDERPVTRRIRGSRDTRSSQTDEYTDDRRRSSSRNSDRLRSSSSDRPRRRRSSTSDDFSGDRFSEPTRNFWDDDVPEDRSRTSSRPSRDADSSSRPRKPRISESSRRKPSESADYVDYQPIDYSDPDADNSDNYDRY